MTQINLHEAKTHFSKYARRVRSGETIILCDRNKPFAEIRPLPGIAKTKQRKLGLLKGLVQGPLPFEIFAPDPADAEGLEADFPDAQSRRGS